MEAVQSKANKKKRYRKTRVGVVTSSKMDKSVVVSMERQAMHSRFLKYQRVSKKVKAHDEKNEYQVGDRVQLIETRPLSKDKHWRVQKLLQRVAEGEK